MAWIFPTAVIVLLVVIAWGAWEAVGVLRHLSGQQATSLRLLGDLEGAVGDPAAFAKAHWKELGRLQDQSLYSASGWGKTYPTETAPDPLKDQGPSVFLV